MCVYIKITWSTKQPTRKLPEDVIQQSNVIKQNKKRDAMRQETVAPVPETNKGKSQMPVVH